jgi:hypothetical protein
VKRIVAHFVEHLLDNLVWKCYTLFIEQVRNPFSPGKRVSGETSWASPQDKNIKVEVGWRRHNTQ